MPTPRGASKLWHNLCRLKGNGPYAYRREDGVYVVPISCLKD